ncbi:type II toxin-antitoxin system HipA family toxin [Roseibium litorale]|uniref:Type II toxin-antitoxin system HipA family toxin n=1 Tax=Roseibium litorale TaxID=2803841 RepID=A0ABR9CL11_9HYPH|nr:type II toxin-antitoxin system HipA family toxin [Roseibium litorale]MBD8891100.1 type II toxin-antitoxin system HipA family toxin [Roseibium litorale]
MTRTLDVYLNDKKAGELHQDDGARLTFAYDRDYLGSGGSAISVSMPLTEAPYPDATSRAYFSGLLPDESARHRLAEALGISRNNPFGLLEVIGGDCAGALSLLPKGHSSAATSQGYAEVLTAEKLKTVLSRLHDRPLLGGEAGIRLSLAGAQDKLAVCLIDGKIAIPKNGIPSTHILKPVILTLEGTVENELFCMKLASRLDLNAPEVRRYSSDGTDVLLVERYDRRQEPDGTVIRLHQEDFCQALAVPPELKYEEEGGPGTKDSQALIQASTQSPAADRLTFQRMLIFHYLVGNADAHAKNYALLYRDKAPDLAPLYDVVCTAAYPRLSKKLAMKIGGRATPDTILLEHWHSLVPPTKGAQKMINAELGTMASKIISEADALLGELASDGIAHPVLKTVRKIIGTRSAMILQALDNNK